MGYRIQYGYRVGDVYRHRQSVTMVSSAPDQAPLAGSSELETVTRVLAEEAGVLTVRFEVRWLAREGLMVAQGQPADGHVTCRMNRSGEVLGADSPTMPGVDAYPDQDLEVGATWRRTGVLAVTHMLEGVERDQAVIVSQGQSAATRLNASQLFDLTRGVQLRSTSVVQTTESDGRVTQVVVESRLVESEPARDRVPG